MNRRYQTLAWVAAIATYLLIVFGAIVRITGSGMGCGDHWPLCNGHLFPPLSDPTTVIEWLHRLIAAVISVPIALTAFFAWRLRKSGAPNAPSTAAYWAFGLLIPQALLGAITVKLELPAWTVIIHFMTANIMLAGNHAVVADFGIARAVSEADNQSLTQTGTVIGTSARCLHWSSPDVVKNGVGKRKTTRCRSSAISCSPTDTGSIWRSGLTNSQYASSSATATEGGTRRRKANNSASHT